MNRGHLYKLLLIAFILAWATYSMLPLTGTNLVEVFLEKGPYKPDATYTNIVKELRDLQKTHPDRAYGNLRVAIGTNDIAHYFPDYDVKAEKDPTVFILNRLQKEASGKLKLGLDLIGGSSFLVEMQTNKLSAISAESALENAVEVLRKRVDKFGVAEPLIQKAGANRILIQMPGLSQDTMDSVTTAIQKAAFLEFRMVHDESSRLFAAQVLLQKLQALRQEIDGVRAGKDIEFVHRMRVASRRMRAALAVFTPCLGARQTRKWTKGIRRITRALGEARDADVQLEFLRDFLSTLADRAARTGINRLILRLKQGRSRCQADVCKAMDRLAEAGLLEEMTAQLEQLRDRDMQHRVPATSPALYNLAGAAIAAHLVDPELANFT